jgi:hypothetical protein
MKTPRILGVPVRIAPVVALLALGGAAATGALVLPSQANDHATTSTNEVTTGQPEATPSGEGTPAEQAAFGQCVAENAKTASENGGQGWNPTLGCTKPGASGSAAANAGENANDKAADGLATADAAGANGAAHANTNGADNASARADNAGTHS